MNDNDENIDSANEALGMLLSVWSNYFDEPADFFNATRTYVQNFTATYNQAATAAAQAATAAAARATTLTNQTSVVQRPSQESMLQTSTSLDTVSTVSHKRKFHSVAVDAENEETEPDGKRQKFSDFLLGPLNPRSTLFGSSNPRRLETLYDNSGSASSDKEAGTNDIINNGENVAEDSVLDTTALDQNVAESALTNVDNVVTNETTASHGTNNVSLTDDEHSPLNSSSERFDAMASLQDQINVHDSGSHDNLSPAASSENIVEPIHIRSDDAEVAHINNFGIKNVKSGFTILTDSPSYVSGEMFADIIVTETLNAIDDDGSGADDAISTLSDSLSVSETNAESCQVSTEDTRVVVSSESSDCGSSGEQPITCAPEPVSQTFDIISQPPVDIVVSPPPEMPQYFPSLFGRSVKHELSPIKSPEKFTGVYRTIFQDILPIVKGEPEEAVNNDEVMPMEICEDEPLQSVASSIEPELLENSSISSRINDSVMIHEFLNDLLDMIPNDNTFETNLTVSLVYDHNKSRLNTVILANKTTVENSDDLIDAEIRGIVDSLLCDVEILGDHSPPDEPMDHTLTENISLDQKSDTVSTVENSNNGDEINPLDVIMTENVDVQGTEEFTSTVESDCIHNDRNLDNPLTLEIMDSNVEVNNLNDAGEQESTVFTEPVGRTFDDNSTPNEPIDHTFDVHSVEESVNRDTESTVEYLNNGDETDSLNIAKTENEVVQSAEEIAYDDNGEVLESKHLVVIHDDSNLDSQPTLEVLGTNVEGNGFNDYVEQYDTVVNVANNVQDHDINTEDQHDEVYNIDEIADSDNIVESKPKINNNNQNDEVDTSNVAMNGQSDDSYAPEMAIPRGRNLYIPPVQDARTFLITGRNDGASSHFIPIFCQNSKDLSKAVEQDEVVPFAFRGEQNSETSGESQAAFKQAINAIPNEEHRLSMQDIVTRHSAANDEIIVLDSDNEDDFNQLAKEIVLDTDAASEDPVPVKVHPSLTKILKKHQTQGISFLYKCLFGKMTDISKKRHTGAILAHCMGLGKTLQVVAFLHTVLTHQKLRKDIQRVLILCPAGVVINWAAEFKKWLTELDRSLDTIEVSELQTANWPSREKILNKWAKARSSVVIMSYELFKSSFKFLDPHLLTSPGPDIVVFDEAHVFNKNEKTQIFEAVRKIKTLRRISLTGTPIQNNLQEYYHMVDFVAPGILGTLKNFKKDFDEKIRAGTTKEANPNDAELMKKRACVLFKQLNMVMDRQNFSVLAKILPKKTEWVIYVRLSEVQQKLYQHFINLRKKSTNMLAQQRAFADEHTLYRIGLYPYWVKICDENEKKKNDKAKMGDWYSQILKSYNCKENDYETGNKLVLFLQLLKWFERLGEKTIVYTYYVEVIDVLMKLLESKAATWFSDGHPAKNRDSTWSWKRDKDFFVIQGDTPKPKRHELIQTFNDPNNKRGRLFIISDAGSMGTNMTGATRFIVFESRHNPSTEIQAIFRAYRIGQTKPVHVYRLVAQGTMEDCIFKRQIVKQQTAARVLDNEGVSRTIQKSEIDELLRFCPAPADMDFAKQPDYAPTGDEEFDTFCLAHREMIVEVRNHDSLIAFNEEEKLAVADNEWSEHLRKSYSLQDDVFSKMQEAEAVSSLTASDEIIDDQQPCSSSSSRNIPQSSAASSFILHTSSVNRPANTQRSVRFNISTPASNNIRQPLRRTETPRPLSNMRPDQSSFRIRTPRTSPDIVIRPVLKSGRIDTPRPSSNIFIRPSFGNATCHPVSHNLHPPFIGNPSIRQPFSRIPPRLQSGNLKPSVRPATTHVLRPALASTSRRPIKRELSPEVICLDDDDVNSASGPSKRPKIKQEGPSSSSQSRKPGNNK